VEVVGGEQTAGSTIERAAAVYRSVGMHPLHVRREIDGFVADRLLEALWREALWLVHDDVATVAEIDDAIRFGAGLRWSFMGTFLTYRIAGGEAGMRHFMNQFGPALKWPWSKLVDVPEITEELLDRLVAQSDEQAAGQSVRELERLRDDCLVAVLQGLRSQGFAAGESLDTYERTLVGRATTPSAEAVDLAAPLVLHHAVVPPEWTDYNGHLHESRYLQVLGDASDALFRLVGVDADYLAAGRSFYTVETHLSFLREVRAGERLSVAIQLLGADDKRMHAFLELRRDDGEVVATAEHLYLHVDTRAGRASAAAPGVAARVERLRAAQAGLPVPDRAGRRIGLQA
jgi:carnitine 3-dehydrogenase